MIKKYFIVFVVLGFLYLEYYYSMQGPDNDDKLPVKVLPFRTALGWGYEIDVDGKIFIHQDFIPAVQGRKSFKSPEDALKVGQLLLEKMKNNKMPVITVDELRRMSIKDI